MQRRVPINPHLLTALILVIAFHGILLVSGNFKRTYDAYVHIFFADHYRRTWFDHWDYRWYTGFPLISYPPGSQQSIGLLGMVIGLLPAFVVVQLAALLNLTLGMYRFAKLWVSEEAAGYAALLIVFSSSICETVHVFGQLPTTFSLGFLLNTLPFVKRWLSEGDWRDLMRAWLLHAATTAGHHVTTLFGAVFFAGPVILLALVEAFRQAKADEDALHPARITRSNIRPLIVRRLRRIAPPLIRTAIYGPGLIAALVLVVLPYWLWSSSDPISQVPIPHASRDSFIENPNAGIVFWLLPYGSTLLVLPYLFYKGFFSRAWPMALSISALFLLGTGGTTPIPKALLGGAFDILTLDRFTFWATILFTPLLGEFVVSMRHGNLARYLREQFGNKMWRITQVCCVLIYVGVAVFTSNFTQFRRFQPDAIDPVPLVAFIEKDEHWRWRYLMLGFGDQMAWVSAQTTATTVDGNYHSARRLPELTTTPVERLEGAKFRGIPGIGSLQQFLAVPDKYNLKYVFSNDQFYDPLLYFSGWHRVQRLENGLVVWEREDIPPLPEILPRREIPWFQRIMWGIVPPMALGLGILALSAGLWGPYLRRMLRPLLPRRIPSIPYERWWNWFDQLLKRWSVVPATNDQRRTRWQIWRTLWQKLPKLKPAPPSAHTIRNGLLGLILFAGAFTVWRHYTQVQQSPEAVVLAYYDDLDFRRFSAAYARLDPQTRPTYDQYLLELSVQGGLVASYGKLDSVIVEDLGGDQTTRIIDVETRWVTALNEYPTKERLILVQRDGQWYIPTAKVDVRVPPDMFIRQAAIDWFAAGRRRVTTTTTSFADVQDRPELSVLSSRLVSYQGRTSIVGEVLNLDVDPADLTVTGILFDENDRELTRYNAQSVINHKILPKEVIPFRIDFEGVAGAVLSDTLTAGEFDPNAFSPLSLTSPIDHFTVYAKAVVTNRDLNRGLAVQDVVVNMDAEQPQIQLTAINNGTEEATIPHILLTYYDANGDVAWVDHAFVASSIRPQRSTAVTIPIVPASAIQVIKTDGDTVVNALVEAGIPDAEPGYLLSLPATTGYAAVRISIHGYFAEN